MSAAYEVLSDPEKRKIYDQARRAAPRPRSSASSAAPRRRADAARRAPPARQYGEEGLKQSAGGGHPGGGGGGFGFGHGGNFNFQFQGGCAAPRALAATRQRVFPRR